MGLARSHEQPLIATVHHHLPSLVTAYLMEWAKRDRVMSVVGVDDAAVVTLVAHDRSTVVVRLTKEGQSLSVVKVTSPSSRVVLYHARFATVEDQLREANYRIVAMTED